MSIEQVMEYWQTRPCNIMHSSKPIGTKEYFDEVEAKKYRAEPHILNFANFEVYKDKEVLEIGCGIGTGLISFARADAKITAVDLSQKSIDIAIQRLNVYNLNATIMHANAEQLSYYLPIHQYDLIYSFGVIHHSPNPRAIIEQLHSYLKPDGELKMMLYSYSSYKMLDLMHRADQWDFGTARKTIQYNSEAQAGSPVSYVYTFKQVEELLAPYFKIKKIWKDHIFTYNIDEYKKGNFVRADEFKDISDEDLKDLESSCGFHTLIIAEKI